MGEGSRGGRGGGKGAVRAEWGWKMRDTMEKEERGQEVRWGKNKVWW